MPSNVVKIARYTTDTLKNMMTMLGTSVDKGTYNEFYFEPLDRAQQEAAYRGDWVARKIVDIPAQDATREWRSWKADDADIDKLEALEKKLQIRRKLRMALVKARLYGGGGLILGFGDGNHEKELNPETVKKDGLKFVHPFAKHEVRCGELDGDINTPNFGLPTYYELNSVNANTTPQARVHPSRVVRFDGSELPDRSLTSDGWGDSVLDAMIDAIKNVGVTTASVASLLQEMKIDVVKIPGFMEGMKSKDFRDKVIERFSLVNRAKSTVSTLLLDKEEEWQRINASFGGVPDLMKLYLLVASGAADIPATRLLSQSPQGLNSTGDGDLRNYYDKVKSEQTNVIEPAISGLDEILIRSALGSRPEEIWYEWAPLWQMTPKEKADVSKVRADTVKVIADTSLVDPEVLADGLKTMLIDDGIMPGIEMAYEEYEKNGEGVDETDPAVQEQFQQLKAGSSPDAPDESARGAARPVSSPGLARPRLRVVGEDEVRRIVADMLRDYDEDQERDSDGKFASGGGGGKEDTVRVYHGTSEDRAREILKNGLVHHEGNRNFAGSYYRSEREGSVYVATSLRMAENYAGIASGKTGNDQAIVEIRVPKSEWAKFSKDERENKSFYTTKGVPASWISKVTVVNDDGKKRKIFKRDHLHTVVVSDVDKESILVYVVVEFPKDTRKEREGVPVRDAAPRTLYVRRDLLNAQEVYDHYAAQLPRDVLMDSSKWHVTVAYSRAPVDWIMVEEDWYGDSVTGNLTVKPGGARLHERLGPTGDAVVLQFASSKLSSRWNWMMECCGCSWDFDEYQPHVTIAWDASKVIADEDLRALEPWRGPLEFGPEIFEEIDEDWKAKEGIEE